MSDLFRRGLVFSVVVMALFLLYGNAWAHEKRTVAGKYQFIVGFVDEPAFSGEMNAIDLRVTEPSTRNERPVEGLEKTLKATVTWAKTSQFISVDLRAKYGKPGSYAGYFMPTQPGRYIFTFTGNIEGSPIEEVFESGPGRFGDVQSTLSLQFPDKIGREPQIVAPVSKIEEKSRFVSILALIGAILAFSALAVSFIAIFRPGSRISRKNTV